MGFFRDQRGTEHRLQNKWAFCTTLVGVLGAVLWLNRGTMESSRVFAVMMVVPMINVFVMLESFREISIAFWLGFQPIAGFWIMLLCLLYVYTDLAYYAFRDIETDNNFKSIYDSALTMVQLAFGADWYIVMESSVGQTYQVAFRNDFLFDNWLVAGILLVFHLISVVGWDFVHTAD